MGGAGTVSAGGFTLVELMIAVAVVGVLSVLAATGVRKYVANAKSVEARTSIGRMAGLASARYEAERGPTATLGLGVTAGASRGLCASALTFVPVDALYVRGRKYQSTPAEWRQGSRDVGWHCLGFSLESPQYFMYFFNTSGDNTSFQAYGDLDGNGVASLFRLSAGVTNGQFRIAPSLQETNPDE